MLNKIINIERTHSWVDGNKAIKSISLFGWIIYRNKNKAIANYNLEKSLNIISNLEKQDCEKDKYLTREISNYLHELHTFEPSSELADSLSKLVVKFRLRKATKELGRIKERNSFWNKYIKEWRSLSNKKCKLDAVNESDNECTKYEESRTDSN